MNYTDVWSRSNKQAAEWLINIDLKRRQYVQNQQEFSVLSVVNGDGQPSAHNPGHPTERKGMQLADLESMRCWIITIEMVESMLSPKKTAFLQYRREAETMRDGDPGRPAWVDYVQANLSRHHGIEIERRTLFDWWRELVELTVRVAIKRGCL